uniref:Elongation factor 1 beta central acidic region eukaryote domain-containing protein n=1 Tax=Leptobrachium leishanense TaxID=445787 RepID=A0A8C5M904_9ANUR
YHALRWYNHMKSYEKQASSLPGVKKQLGKHGPVNIEDTTDTSAKETKEDDDDIDLFGSDDEEENEEAKRIQEELCVRTIEINNDKVGTDLLEERITAFEDFFTSMKESAYNKQNK